MQDTQQKECIVCKMLLNTEEDYPKGADMKTSTHCKYCGNKDGLFSYFVLLEKGAKFLAESKGMDADEARKKSKELLKNSQAAKEGVLSIE